MRGGITPMPPPFGIRGRPPRPVPPSSPIEPRERSGAIARPPDIDDIAPERGERRNDGLADPIAVAGRERKESAEPPPIRPGMKPSNRPPYGMIMGLRLAMPAAENPAVAP